MKLPWEVSIGEWHTLTVFISKFASIESNCWKQHFHTTAHIPKTNLGLHADTQFGFLGAFPCEMRYLLTLFFKIAIDILRTRITDQPIFAHKFFSER